MKTIIKCFLALAIGYAILMLLLNVVFSILALQSGVDNSIFFYEKAIPEAFGICALCYCLYALLSSNKKEKSKTNIIKRRQ